jgi:hypothetical protein
MRDPVVPTTTPVAPANASPRDVNVIYARRRYPEVPKRPSTALSRDVEAPRGW